MVVRRNMMVAVRSYWRTKLGMLPWSSNRTVRTVRTQREGELVVDDDSRFLDEWTYRKVMAMMSLQEEPSNTTH